MKKTLYILISILVISCSSGSDDNKPNNLDDFNRQQILTNTYDNIIIPAYNDFNNKLTVLENNTNEFITDVNEQNLNNLRTSWVAAYKSWQSIEMFDLRKAEEIIYARVSNSYPCIEERVLENINDSVVTISFTGSMLGATGFPAIGYLIYGNDSSSIIMNFNGNNAQKYSAYLNALVQNLVENTNSVIDDWSSARADFVNSTANTQTSSLNILVNDFVYYLEKKIRTAKIGNPIDFFGTMQPKPELVESYYRPDICKSLVFEAMNSVKMFYTGNSYDGTLDGIGLEDYLNYLDNSEDLITTINNLFDDIDNKINLLEDDFILELNIHGKDRLQDLFLSMQNLVIYFKIDMMTDRFGITPDYEDNDGDGG